MIGGITAVVTVAVLSTVVLVTSAPAKLPDSFPKCKKADSNIDQCLQQSIQKAIPELVKGVPSVGLLPIDPLTISELVIDHGGGPVAVDLVFKNLLIKGFKSAKINKVTSDIDNYKLTIEAELPDPLVLDGDYEVSGKVLVLPITGKGKCYLQLDNIKAELTLKGKEVKKNGKIHMEVTDFDVKFQTSMLKIRLDNLFNGDKALGDNMNIFLNENWSDILKELKPSFEQALGATFKQIAARLYSKVPYNEIYM